MLSIFVKIAIDSKNDSSALSAAANKQGSGDRWTEHVAY